MGGVTAQSCNIVRSFCPANAVQRNNYDTDQAAFSVASFLITLPYAGHLSWLLQEVSTEPAKAIRARNMNVFFMPVKSIKCYSVYTGKNNPGDFFTMCKNMILNHFTKQVLIILGA